MDSQWVDLLIGDRMTLQETVWMMEEEAYASREAWAYSIGSSELIRSFQTIRICVCKRRPSPGTSDTALAAGHCRAAEERLDSQATRGLGIPGSPVLMGADSAALTWWNGQIRTLGPEAYTMTWEVLKNKIDGQADDYPETKPWSDQQQPSRGGMCQGPTSNGGSAKWEALWGIFAQVHQVPSSPQWRHQRSATSNGTAPRELVFECGAQAFQGEDCPKLKNKDGGNRNAQGWIYAVGNAEKRGNASRNPDANVVRGTFLLDNHYASIVFDTGADRSFISTAFSSLINIAPTPLENCYDVELADGKLVRIDIL
ncbi:putative reverse transcriptase domain-containing protein [Tanacetum coccineum]